MIERKSPPAGRGAGSYDPGKTVMPRRSGAASGSAYRALLWPADEIHLGPELCPEVNVCGVTQLRQIMDFPKKKGNMFKDYTACS